MRFHSSGGKASARAAGRLDTVALRAPARRRAARRRSRASRSIAGCRVPAAEDVLNEAERHPDAGARESDVPVDALREVPGDERPENGAEVDPHVEDREPGVATRVVRVVERADDACSRSA